MTEDMTGALTGEMSEHEQLMWNIEQDPWLNPNGSGLVLVDQPIDADRFKATMARAVASQPELTQRVVPAGSPIGRLRWAPDAEFDLDRHVMTRTLPSPGTERQLLDLATELYLEPLDRNHALWRFVIIDGLQAGGGALWMLTHHAISDGIGQVEMASLYYSLSPDEPTEPEVDVDLDAIIAQRVEAHAKVDTGCRKQLLQSATTTARRHLEASRDVAAEVAMWGADPSRIGDRLSEAKTSLRTAAQALTPGSGSPLLKQRSADRHLEHVSVPLDQLKSATKSLGASINDGFVASMIEGCISYHADHDVALDTVRASFVMSTRSEGETGAGNAFTPVVVEFTGASMPWPDRLTEIRERIGAAREETLRTGGVSSLSGIANALPTSMVTRTARSQAASIDFATSNIRGVPFPLYVANAEVQHVITQGPLAGTPCNATAMSTNGVFDVGLFTDPAAVTDPVGFRHRVQEAFDQLLHLVS